MDPIQSIAGLVPEVLKLGGWGALIILFLARVIVTKKEKDEAVAVERERVADKHKQLEILTEAVREGDMALSKLASSWETAINIITRQRKDQER